MTCLSLTVGLELTNPVVAAPSIMPGPERYRLAIDSKPPAPTLVKIKKIIKMQQNDYKRRGMSNGITYITLPSLE